MEHVTTIKTYNPLLYACIDKDALKLKGGKRNSASAFWCPHDCLGLKELFEPPHTPFATISGLFVSPPRGGKVNAGAIEMHHAGSQLTGHGLCVCQRTSVHIPG
ncbi:hypothetical protein D3C78_1585010 [compost metagenome]